MASDEQVKHVTRKLKQWIENDRKVVTYRDVSREVGCHVNLAKNLLLKHHLTHPTSATYLLTGPLLRESTLAQTQLPPLSSQYPGAGAGDGNGPGGTQSLAHLAKSGAVKIVDMDEMSDDERNSEHDLEDYDGEKGPEGGDFGDGIGVGDGIGNDDGGEGGIAGVGTRVRVKREGGDEAAEEGEGKGGGGVIKAEEVRRWGVVLVGEDGLEEKKTLFEDGKLSIHIYALAPTVVKDPAQYLLSPLHLRSLPNYQNPSLYGTITGDTAPALAVGKGKGKGEGMKDGGIDFGAAGKKDAVAGTGKGGKADKVQGGKDKGEKVEDKIAGVVKKEKDADEVVKAQPEELKVAKAAISSTSVNPSQSKAKSKKRVIQSDDEGEATDTDPPPAASASSSKSQMKNGSGIEGKKEKKQVEPTSSLVRQEDTAAMEAMMGMDLDMDLEGGEDEGLDLGEGSGATARAGDTKAGAGASETKVKTEPGARKRRRVKKSKMEMDEKGYMVTKDYETDESYSGDSEPDQSATTSSKAKAKTSAAASSSKARPSVPGAPKSGSTESIDKKPNIKPGGAAGGAGARGPGAAGGGGLKKGAGGQSTLQGFFKRK